MRDTITKTLMEDPEVLQIHAFYVDKEKKFMSFDVVLDFTVKEPVVKEVELRKKVLALYPDYDVAMLPDRDFTLTRADRKGEVEKEVEALKKN